MYQTKQKTAIIEYLKANSESHLAVDQILFDLNKRNIKVSSATLYRFLDNLINLNMVRKIILDNSNKACFQYINSSCHSHYHLMCTKCNKLYHLRCDEIDELIDHVYKNHDFKIEPERILLYGICKDCEGK